MARESAAYSQPAPTEPAPRGRRVPTFPPSIVPPSSFRSLRDRRADEVAPLGPRPVVVPHLLDAEQVLKREPGMARPLADAAVGDDLVPAVDGLRPLVQLQQLLERLEGAVGGHGLAPWDVPRARDVTGALRRLGRSEEHTSELQSLAYLVCRLLLE